MTEKKRPIRTPISTRFRRAFKTVFPLCIWLAASTMCGYLLYHGPTTMQFKGSAETFHTAVYAQEDSTIRSLTVALFSKVSSSQCVGTLDDKLLNYEIDVLTASRKVLEAEVEAEEARLVAEAYQNKNSLELDWRRVSIDEDRARLDLLDRKAQDQVDRVTLQQLVLEYERTAGMAKDGVTPQSEADMYRIQKEALEKQIAENEKLIAQAEESLEALRQRSLEFERQNFTPPSDDVVAIIEPIRTQIDELEAQVRSLNASRERWLLKSPIDGVVVAIHRRVGEAVAVGDAVLTVANGESRHIVAYIPDAYTGIIDKDAPVRIRRWNGMAQVGEGKILDVGPSVIDLPIQLLSTPNFPEWGIPVLVDPPKGARFVPGERVRLEISG